MRVDEAVHSPCAIEPVGELLFGKWTAHVLWALAHEGPLRFGALRGVVASASPKVLTARLRQLERDGLVQRRRYAELPPRCEYTITPLGRSLVPACRELAAWSETHMDDVRTAREQFDSTSPAGSL